MDKDKPQDLLGLLLLQSLSPLLNCKALRMLSGLRAHVYLIFGISCFVMIFLRNFGVMLRMLLECFRERMILQHS